MLLQGTHIQLAELSHTSTSHGPKQHLLLPQQHHDSAEEFKFTLAAARRTELRRLRNFVKMADYMMCDTLQQVCHVLLRPPPGKEKKRKKTCATPLACHPPPALPAPPVSPQHAHRSYTQFRPTICHKAEACEMPVLPVPAGLQGAPN